MSGAVSLDEFITGVLSALRLSDVEHVYTKGAEAQLVRSFRVLEELSQSKFLELRFHCQWNPTTRQCPAVSHALLRAAQNGMISRDRHSWKLGLTAEDAARNIKDSPLSLKEWQEVSANLRSSFPFEPLIP